MTSISVIIPAYNAASTLIEALESVRMQTSQVAFEIIIVNDGSTDETEQMVKKYCTEHPGLNIIYLPQENKGVSAARNLGIKKATGDYIALLDADDIWLPKKTEKQLLFLENPDLNIEFLATRRNGKKLLFPYSSNDKLVEVTFRKLLFRNEITSPSVVFRKSIINKIGGFDEKMKYAEDINFYLRISQYFPMYILNESLVIAGGGKRSFGTSGLSQNLKSMHKGFIRNLEIMHEQNRISKSTFHLYKIYYYLKYALLKLRVFMKY